VPAERRKTMTSEDGWQQIGRHRVRFEGPDILHLKIVGDLTLAEVTRLLQMDEVHPIPEKGYFAFINVGDAGKPNLDILKSQDLMKKMSAYRAMVYYRAQFQHRTVVEIVQKITNTLKLSLRHTPFVAFVEETEGRAWIDSFRREHN
jgi:hypothetical protein